MTETDIKSRINSALVKLYCRSSDLIQYGVHERTLTAELACFLKTKFRSWDVDVEYNRDGLDSKKDSDERRIFPDIIIHHRTLSRERGAKEDNLVAIQVKGCWNTEDRRKDEEKLHDMKMRYGYQFLFRIELKKENYDLIEV